MVKLAQKVFAFLLVGATSSVLAAYCDNDNGLSGSGSGTQFITGCCKSDADCQSGCCSFMRGQCVGAVAARENGPDGGCGYGGSSPGNGSAFPSNGVIPTTMGPPYPLNSTSVIPVGVSSDGDSSDEPSTASNGTLSSSDGDVASSNDAVDAVAAKWRRNDQWTTHISPFPTGLNHSSKSSSTTHKTSSTKLTVHNPWSYPTGTGGYHHHPTGVYPYHPHHPSGNGAPRHSTRHTTHPTGTGSPHNPHHSACPKVDHKAGLSNGKLHHGECCKSDADCASKCCGNKSGRCASAATGPKHHFCGFGEKSSSHSATSTVSHSGY